MHPFVYTLYTLTYHFHQLIHYAVYDMITAQDWHVKPTLYMSRESSTKSLNLQTSKEMKGLVVFVLRHHLHDDMVDPHKMHCGNLD